MRRGLVAAMRCFCLPTLAIACLGCRGAQVSLVDTGVVRLDSSAPGNVAIAWSDAYEREDGFVVTGVVRRMDTVGPPIRVTVAAEIVSASGFILETAQSDSLYVPHRRTTKTQGFQRFRVRFSEMPPEGSSVRIRVGNG